MNWSAANLPWLPAPPDEFRNLCKSLDNAEGEKDEPLRSLASYALDLSQLTRLAKSATRVIETDNLKNLSPFTLGLAGNGTMSLIAPALVASALRYGIALKVIEAPYDQTVQWALDKTSPFHLGEPDAVLFAFDHRIIPNTETDGSELETALSMIETVRTGMRGIPVIVQTMAPPPEGFLGSFDTRILGSYRNQIIDFNSRLIESLKDSSDILFDVAGIAQLVGIENWHDERQWFMSKLPFAPEYTPLYADHLGRIIGAMRGKSRKCLVLDLDNTLWGGVIGDDGLKGISLGQGDATGEAFVEIQHMALDLRRHGIVLAVSSKNDDATARLPFQEHPDMVLKEDDIAVFQANWTDKASNLEAIAKALNISVDALVLLDDNPAERAQVRGALPTVAVPELPNDPSLYRRTLLAAGYFETVGFSDEDRRRADQYQANAKRAELSDNAPNLGDFLNSLNMNITFSPFDETGRSRIAQLINKSNQFNLTTRRYSEAEIEKFQNDPAIFTLQVRLTDIFGDNGMISVVICKKKATEWEIDTWLMSCRVLGRQVEEAVLGEIANNARKNDIKGLIGRYIPSGRNKLVQDHYKKLSFQHIQDDGKDGAEWLLDIQSFEASDLPMTVIYSTPDEA
jgi:FkbH-like protein